MAGPTRSSTGLNRDRIVDVALDLVAREGLGELSMRRLAGELGAGTMSIYNHVAGKDELLDAMVERVLSGVRVAASPDWRELVTTWATDLRAALLDHRAMIHLVVAPDRVANIGRLGVAVHEALCQVGVEPDEAAHVVRVVGRYVAGAVLLDAPPTRPPRRAPRAVLDRTFSRGLDALLIGLEEQLGRGS